MFGSKNDKPAKIMKVVVDTVAGLGSFAAGWQAVAVAGADALTVTVKRAKPEWHIDIPYSDITGVEVLPPNETATKRDCLRVTYKGGAFTVQQAAGLPIPFKALCDALAAAVPQSAPDPAALVGRKDVLVETPESTETLVRVYDYAGVELYHPETPDYSRLVIGDHCNLIQEPANGVDSRAVYVEYDGYKLGYLYRGKMQDMANDWLDRDDPLVAVIEQVLPDDGRVNIHLGFYKENV